ncbi:MAG: gabP, partial [Mycobacterium sp.]|nr:gabP [Mycobacterium sp.]
APEQATANAVVAVALARGAIAEGDPHPTGDHLGHQLVAGELLTTSAVGRDTTTSVGFRSICSPSQFGLGRAMRAEGERAPVRMWLFPYLTIAVIVAIVAVLVLMAFDPDQQQAIFLSLISAVFIVGAGVVVHRRRDHRRTDSAISPS